MDELLRLLAQAENIGELGDEELAELRDAIRAEADALLAGEPSDEDLEVLERAASAIESITAEESSRAAAADERSARAAAIAERIRGEQVPDDEGEPDEGEPDEGDGDEEGEPVEGEVVEEDADAVAAAARRRAPASTRTPARTPATRVSRVAARRPREVQPTPRTPEPLAMVAAANLPNIPAGAPLNTPDRLARAFISAYQASSGYRGPRVKVPVARIGGDPLELYGEDRFLGQSAEENERRIQAVVSVDAVTAAGGICAPTEVRYDLPVIAATDARPFRDEALARFGADRGGVRTLPPPILTDVSGSVATWTHANDINPVAPATKPCLSVTCPTAEETIVDAVTRCLEFGNFRARFFPEQVRAWLDMAAAYHARYAETRLMTGVGTGSTQVTAPQVLGAMMDVLAALDRALAAMRSRHRVGDNFPMRFVAPRWLRDLLRVDMARRLPYGTAEENLAVADGTIQRWIETRNVNVTWTLDGETGQVFGAQADGALIGWPSTVVTYLYPEGSWLFLDGGELDLGIVRDSSLNATNDYQVFAETFENVHFHGVESYRLVLDICPSGAVAGTATAAVCLPGDAAPGA